MRVARRKNACDVVRQLDLAMSVARSARLARHASVSVDGDSIKLCIDDDSIAVPIDQDGTVDFDEIVAAWKSIGGFK